jgi:hypothetical protein
MRDETWITAVEIPVRAWAKGQNWVLLVGDNNLHAILPSLKI